MVWRFAEHGMFNFKNSYKPLRDLSQGLHCFSSLSLFTSTLTHQLPAASAWSLIITGWMAEPSHPKEEETASKAHECATHLSLLPFVSCSPSLWAKKYKVPTKEERPAMRGKAKTILPPHSPSKMFTAGVRYHRPDWWDKQTRTGDSRGVSIGQRLYGSHGCSYHVLASRQGPIPPSPD